MSFYLTISGDLTIAEYPVVFAAMPESGLLNGKMTYTSNDGECWWENGGPWYLQGSADVYQPQWRSFDDVATPDLVTTWEPTGDALGIPVVTLSQDAVIPVLPRFLVTGVAEFTPPATHQDANGTGYVVRQLAAGEVVFGPVTPVVFANLSELETAMGLVPFVFPTRLHITAVPVGSWTPPNMSTTQKLAMATPAPGEIIFDTGLNKLCVFIGTGWETITSQAPASI